PEPATPAADSSLVQTVPPPTTDSMPVVAQTTPPIVNPTEQQVPAPAAIATEKVPEPMLRQEPLAASGPPSATPAEIKPEPAMPVPPSYAPPSMSAQDAGSGAVEYTV